MKKSELNPGEYNAYYQTYIDNCGEVDLLETLIKQSANFPKFIESIPDEKFHYAYADDKWTVGEALLHIIDAERVFQYRALRFSRKDETPLSGFDQDVFISGAKDIKKTKESLIADYKAVRSSTISLFSSFDDEVLKQMGTASDSPISVLAIGFIICGHQRHHRNIIKERYL